VRHVALDPGDSAAGHRGAKGITSESAIALAIQSHASLALIGRGHPDDDAELSQNLSRMDDLGLRYR